MTDVVAQSIADAAASVGLSRAKLYALITEGKGPPIVKCGKRTLVRVADRDAWLATLPTTTLGRDDRHGR